MVRLRRVSVSSPGYGRRRHGKGFSYLDVDGSRLTDRDEVARCTRLVVPPAWTDVWICRYANGHVQAFGYDDAGRGQYLYHDQWRERRARRKFDHVLAVGARLPAARRRVAKDLALDGIPRDKVLALAFRLLDLAYFRAGSEAYAKQNGSYGLATLLTEHVRVRRDGSVHFRYPAKSGQVRDVVVEDERVREVVTTLVRRRGAAELLAWREETPDGVVWHDVTSTDVTGYLKDRLGEDATAKDFRTWHASVLAARALAEAGDPPRSARARRAVVASVVRDVADELGNTPAVARSSYVDPRLIDLWEAGRTIAPLLGKRRSQAAVERAVLDLLG
ncbi:DNA topoisomerase IB [Oerskovia enterophila]|uniref:DNA topoisomerase n=1 Tax=Oerskovia enterophila TaxID=43678 RepID=A0ABX2Y3J2_9CELL|nr:DNA topoisomerase IB [Oerskovia enterophila]OCI31123.1 eukaryotic DNA topoisomerase I, catalytic core [Oerskovia enterophila]